MAIKVKCSDNILFRVSPVFCLLEPGSAQRLQIVRDPGPAKVDKIIIEFKATSAGNPRDAFRSDDRSGNLVEKKSIALIAKDDITLSIAPTTNLKSILRQSVQN